jgi:hypothetical protein
MNNKKEMSIGDLFLLSLGIFLFLFTAKIAGDMADERDDRTGIPDTTSNARDSGPKTYDRIKGFGD